MIKIILENYIDEGRSKTRFLDEASREIKNFIINQLKKFPKTYFQKTDSYEFKIRDLPSIKNNPQLSNLNDLTLEIHKRNQERSVIVPEAYYHPDASYIRIVIYVSNYIKSFDKIEEIYYNYMHKNITELAYHELVHHLQYVDYRTNFSKERKAFSTVTTPVSRFVVNNLEGASEEEIKEYNYLSEPHEIEAYVRDMYYKSRKNRNLFSKNLAKRFRQQKSHLFTSNKGKQLYWVIVYNMLKYALERYPNLNDETNKEIFKKIDNYLNDNRENLMEKQITAENLTHSFRRWVDEDIISEASVGQLMSSHKIPKSFAKHAKTKCSNGNINFIVEVFLKNYKSMVENMTSEAATDREKMLSDNYIMEFDRFMGYAGKTLDEYLKKHKGKKYRKELMELCEQGWTKFLKKMREYKKSQETLNEQRLSKTWKSRAKNRARRYERPVSEDDKKWAKQQQKKWHKDHPELEEAYLAEIEKAMEAAKASKTYLEKIKLLRKQKIENKKALVKPTPEELKNRKKPPTRPTADKRRPNQKIKGPFAAAGETIGSGPLEELELYEENTNE